MSLATLSALPASGLFSAEAAGVSRRTLGRLVSVGAVEKVGRGLYRLMGSAVVDVDLAEVVARSPQATICLDSALTRHGLITEIPAVWHLAVPRGRNPAVVGVPTRWHLFDAATFDVGRTLTPVTGSLVSIGLYSAERSIVDAFRLRHQVGFDVAVEALRTWLRRRGSSPATLMEVAALLPRAERPLRAALEVLL